MFKAGLSLSVFLPVVGLCWFPHTDGEGFPDDGCAVYFGLVVRVESWTS